MVRDADRALLEYLAENPSARAEWEQDHKLRQDPRVSRSRTRMERIARVRSRDQIAGVEEDFTTHGRP